MRPGTPEEICWDTVGSMISIDEARVCVLDNTIQLPAQHVELCQSLGAILAADIASDIDSPPHDKSLVDGFAVRSSDLNGKSTLLRVVEVVDAGAVPTVSIGAGQCARVMTGAPISQGADAVVMVEDTNASRTDDVENVTIQSEVKVGDNIQFQGHVFKKHQVLLSSGTVLRPIEIGLLAEIGCSRIPVVGRPKVGILPTGDELVDVAQVPKAGQIRNSNGPMLSTLVAKYGNVDATVLPIGRDDPQVMHDSIQAGLKNDLLLLTGGVSMGRKDLVPDLLAEFGVECRFHRVHLRPGKPLWFGVRKNEEGRRRTIVFGLPGNPVSAFVCSLLFVRPTLQKLTGAPITGTGFSRPLASDFQWKGTRPSYLPVAMQEGEVRVLPWKGSADQWTLCQAFGLAFFPGSGTYVAGTEVDVLPF